MYVTLFNGMADVADMYGCLILDFWGVLHDGRRAYPDACDCLARLRGRGLRLAAISNSSRSTENLSRLIESIGIEPRLFDCILSAGELARLLLADRAGKAPRCLVLGDRTNLEWVDQLNLRLTEDPTEADLLLAVGILQPGIALADTDELLRKAAAATVPMVCANPDEVVLIDGAVFVAAGAIAKRYEGLGGQVQYFGKPHPEIYLRCLDMLAVGDSSVAAVGDSLATDVAGASGIGLSTILVVSTGVHAADLGLALGEMPEEHRLTDLCSRFGVRPTAAIPSFKW